GAPLSPLGPAPAASPFPYTTLFRSRDEVADQADGAEDEQSRARHLGRNEEAADSFDETVHAEPEQQGRLSSGRQNLSAPEPPGLDRKSTRLNSSHVSISYAVFCLKK